MGNILSLGQYIVSGSRDLVKVWSVSARKEVASLAGHAGIVWSVAFSPDGQLVVSGSGDKLVKVWSVSGKKQVASPAGHTNYVYSVAFSPDGEHIVSGSGDNLVKVKSLSGGKEVASLAGHANWVCSVAFSPDGQHIVSGSEDVGQGVVVNGTLLFITFRLTKLDFINFIILILYKVL